MRNLRSSATRELKRERIEWTIAQASFHVRYQPILRLHDETVAG